MPVRNRSGATLPLTILVISILGVSVAISYARLSSERRITGDGQAQIDAFAVAQSGLNTYLATRTAKPTAHQDTTYTDLPGGTARVNLQVLRESTTTLLPAIYVVSSRGTATGAKRYDARSPAAERTVATYVLWTPAPFDLDAAFTSLSGIDKNGNSGTLNGNDACGAASAIPGAAVPIGTYTGQTGPIDGNPDNTPSSSGPRAPREPPRIQWASTGPASRRARSCRPITCTQRGPRQASSQLAGGEGKWRPDDARERQGHPDRHRQHDHQRQQPLGRAGAGRRNPHLER